VRRRCVGGARDGGLSCSAQEPRRASGCRAAVTFRVIGARSADGGCTGSSICILVVSVHVSRGDTVIRAASRSRLSAYRDFDFYHDDFLCAGSSRARGRPVRLGAQPKRSDVWGRSRESSTGKISRVLHEDMFHMTQHHHMLLKPTRDVREGKAWAGMAKTPLQFPAQHQ